MKKNKYIIIALVSVFLLPFLYKYYLYYKIPYNPLLKITSNITSCSVTEYKNPPYDPVDMLSSHSYDCSIIYNYLTGLRLKPLKYDDHSTNYDIERIDYRYSISFLQPDLYNDITIGVWNKDLSVIYISSNNPDFKDGYYKIEDTEFDYKYINELISLQI